MTVAEALRLATAALAAAGCDSPALDARLLLGHAMGVAQSALLLHRDATVPEGEFEALLARRVAREPLAFILGRQGFWSLDFAVSPATLIPRADSETLIEAAVAWGRGRRVRRVLDLGTGTGCLLCAALMEFPEAIGVGVDLNPAAAALACANARALGLASRCGMVAGRWGDALNGRFDLVLSNPPYIGTGELAGLMPEVGLHEPPMALDGGADGLAAYRALLGALPGLLATGGLAVLELGLGQAEPVAALAAAAGFDVGMRRDLGGVERAILIEKKVGRGAWPD